MSKEAKNMLVPKLRFPEFKLDGSWDEKTFGEVTYPVSEKNKEGKQYPIYSINNVEGFLPQSDQFEGVDSHDRGYDVSLYKLIGKNTFAYNPARINVGSIGYSGELHDIIISSLYVCFKTTEALYDLFLIQFLKTNSFNKSVKKNVEGGIRNYLFYENFSRINLFLPSIKEQQKIADCLSSLDELITAEDQKLEALKVHKKGLMQQLFPRRNYDSYDEMMTMMKEKNHSPSQNQTNHSSDNVPKLRFAEFKDSGDWVETILSEVANYENGKAHEQDIVEEGEYIVVNSKFISSEGKVKKYTNTAFCIAAKGDILMVLSDVPNGKTIAKCFFVEADNLYSVNQRICKITAFDANGLMLFYVLNRNPYFLAFDDGVKQTNFRNDDVLNFPMLLPKDPKEKQRIGECLSSLDELITAQSEKIEALQAHKKGLMQQLFPLSGL